jgi:transposase-like protein
MGWSSRWGVTVTGEKVILGVVQTATENERVCAALLRELLDRGLRIEQGLLCVIDGAAGLGKAIQMVCGFQAMIHRYSGIKRANTVAYLPTSQRALRYRTFQAVSAQPSYTEAKAALLQIRQPLCLLNESAVASAGSRNPPSEP